jgi:hypothetical protein
VLASVEAASSFLLSAREGDGLWRDFEVIAGASDEWVSAYVGCSLARSKIFSGLQGAATVLNLLCGIRTDREGWGYNWSTPADADSTLWVCRLARALNAWPEACVQGMAFLNRCIQDNGGLATYPSSEAVRKFIGLPSAASLEGWCSGHVCVTAGAAVLPGIGDLETVRAYLRRTQTEAGNWHGYWWGDSEYPTLLAVQALAAWGEDEDEPRIDAAAKWVAQCCPTSSAFALACRVRILAVRNREAATRLASTLVEMQNSDGSWPSSALMRIPPPHIVDPESAPTWSLDRKGFASLRLDQNRLYTTATALEALQAIL